MFDFEVVPGDLKSAIESPFSLILTESEALRLFNNKNLVGETVILKTFQDLTFTVNAVVNDLPSNSSIQFHGLYNSNKNFFSIFVSELKPKWQLTNINLTSNW